ncbi:NTPase KAP family P-loop domain-containing protein 1-like [Scleropages formosus]|uniref:NTPase KAP family P-loop domain-containing protein 1-like n=1 Tax=Scleropages formosus TaxID=113540 RepID=A0A0P7UGP8_SCLFO|nr:NTPase KAP family P-loop domain-containing protein 1-like [Scleropages formosus]
MELPSDGVYAYALSKTLIRVAPPATVGLYSSCHSRISQVLKNIEVHMEREAKHREEKYKEQPPPRSKKASIVNFLAILSRLLFYHPVYTEENQNRKNVRYIFVRFSAWHFAGSDILWAGLVVRLYMAIQEHFGRFLLSLYRVTQYTEKTTKHAIVNQKKDWRPKKICCIPLWLLTLLISLVALTAVPALLIKNSLQKGKDDADNEKESGDGLNAVEGFAIATLGVPVVAILRFVFLIGKNLIFNQDFKIRRMMDNEKVSNKLGFMNEIRREMEVLSCFIRFVEIFERRKIRVVLEITHLDRCTPRKIVGVLDAINILLSDEDSPFISLLAVNPEVLAQQVDYAEGCFSKEDKACAFLNRIVTLAFTVPELCNASKCKMFHKISQGQLEFLKDSPTAQGNGIDSNALPSVEYSSMERGGEQDSCIPLHSRSDTEKDVTFLLNEDKVEKLIESALEYIYGEGNLHYYITGDTMSMRRIINSVRVSVILLEALKTELSSMEDIAAWVLLANQWPCRLSWILQFTIKDAHRFKISTVNLDHSIQRELARVRGSSILKDIINMETLIPLQIKSVINMNTEDVCREMARLGLPERYAEAVRCNALNGQALVYSDTNELREVLQMSLGDWTTFAIHFLGLEVDGHVHSDVFVLLVLSPPRPYHDTQENPADAESQVTRQVHRVQDEQEPPAVQHELHEDVVHRGGVQLLFTVCLRGPGRRLRGPGVRRRRSHAAHWRRPPRSSIPAVTGQVSDPAGR